MLPLLVWLTMNNSLKGDVNLDSLLNNSEPYIEDNCVTVKG